jgi:single-stranded DNA-binding protein
MNNITIMGYLEGDPTFRNEKSHMIECVVVTVKNGSGAYADRKFYDKFKVQFYSREAEALSQHADMAKGAWVFVIGEARAEAWVGRDTKPHGRICIIAKTLSPCVFDQRTEP